MPNNRLSKERQALVLASLCAGTPINAICRIYRADKAAVLRVIRETGEAFADYMDRLDELKAMVGFAQRYDHMQELLAQIVLLNGETSDRQVDPDAEAIKLTTVHQAKGLEYDVVFIIGLADGQFPGRRSIEAGDVEEERRLFYVAVTRARNELYLCYPRVATRAGPGGMLLNPSRFLTEIDASLYQPLKIKRSYGW